MEKKLINEHKAVSDTGEEFSILEYQEYIDAGEEEIPGFKSLVTTDGLVVNFIDPKTQRCLFFYDKYAVIRGLRASTACLQGVLTSKESLSHRIN